MTTNDFAIDPELQAFVEERLGNPVDPDVDPEDDDEEEVEPDTGPGEEEPDAPVEPDTEEGGPGEAPPAPEPTPPDPTLVELAPGIAIPRDQALSYYQFDAILKGDPELQRMLTEHIQGGAGGSSAPAPAPPALPPLELSEDDLSDPAISALYKTYQQQQDYLSSLENRVKQLTDVTVTREQEELNSLIASSKTSFASAHSLDTAQMDRVAEVAERMNVLPSLLRGIDPYTGAHEPRDRTTALSRAFEIAYWAMPDFREKALADQVQERAKATRRKQRLAGISGSGGSVPKNSPAPRNEQERRAAMIQAVSEAMGQTNEE